MPCRMSVQACTGIQDSSASIPAEVFHTSAEWNATLHPSVSASLHSHMEVQQKLRTAASASVQACTGAEIQQQARKCTELMSVQACTCIKQCKCSSSSCECKRAFTSCKAQSAKVVSCKRALAYQRRSKWSSARRAGAVALMCQPFLHSSPHGVASVHTVMHCCPWDDLQ
jgi:hypothetical protein